MKMSWINGLSEQEQLDVTQNFKESLVMRRRLKKLLLDLVEETRTQARANANYESPSWPYQQADKIGYERALFKALDLLED